MRKIEIRAAISAARGNISAMARKLMLHPQQVTRLVTRAGLMKMAANLRRKYGVSGARSAADKEDLFLARCRREMERHGGNQSAAARALKIGRTRLQRAIARAERETTR